MQKYTVVNNITRWQEMGSFNTTFSVVEKLVAIELTICDQVRDEIFYTQ